MYSVGCTIFFFKKEATFLLLRGFVGTDVYISSRASPAQPGRLAPTSPLLGGGVEDRVPWFWPCLLYTSYVADDLLCLNLVVMRLSQ